MEDSQISVRNKRRRSKASVDRISSLPDSVLRHILLFPPTKDAIKTGALSGGLSKVWQFLWTSVPAIDFSFPFNIKIINSHFYQAIEKTLILHSSPKITKFRIAYLFEDALKPQIDYWVRFAVSRQVEELRLHFCGESAAAKYLLPCFLYNNPTLTKLSI